MIINLRGIKSVHESKQMFIYLPCGGSAYGCMVFGLRKFLFHSAITNQARLEMTVNHRAFKKYSFQYF